MMLMKLASLFTGFLLSWFFFFGAAQAADKKGPKITNVVFFDIEHGGKPLGRSE